MGMGCFSCFDSKEEEQLNTDHNNEKVVFKREEQPMVPPRIDMLPSGLDKVRSSGNLSCRRESVSPRDGSGVNISAQTFTFRELAEATQNFRPECLIGEGGFGMVYKGRLESTGQVVAVKQLDRNGLQGNREFWWRCSCLAYYITPTLLI